MAFKPPFALTRWMLRLFLLDQSITVDPAISFTALLVKSLPILRLLLEHGWDINTPVEGYGGHAILWVLEDEELVCWFFDNGARVDAVAQSPYEPSILDVAAAKASTVVFESLLNHGAPRAKGLPLHMAAASGKNGERIPMLTYLIAAGYDVNAADQTREPWNIRKGTPLQYAVLAESVPNVEFLVRHGADPRNEGGVAVSAYTLAERMELKDVIRLFQDPKLLH